MTDPKKDDELDALRARVAELERAAKPAEPYVTDWVVPPPAIDRVSMSPATLRELVQAVPDNVLRDIVRDNRAPTGPTSQGPASTATSTSSVPKPIGTGWAREIPLSPPPGIGYVDMLARVDEAKQRGEAMIEETRRKATEDKPR